MSVDPTVISAMETALAAEPDNVAIRLHLAGLLLDAGRPADAFDHCKRVLAAAPDNLDALRTTVSACQAMGDDARASSYHNIYEALSMSRAKFLIDTVNEDSNGDAEPSQNDADLNASPDDEDDTDFTADDFLSEFDEVVDDEDDDDISIESSDDEDGRIRIHSDNGTAEPDEWETERPTITLVDVAGMEQVKRRLQVAFFGPMKNPEMRKLYGKSLRGGLLLYGPPGCGKTYIARATAGEMGARFLAVGLSDVLDMWLGQSEQNLHTIFDAARHHAPCVLFFDEIDALGRKRSLMRESAGRDIVNQLLAELDGIQGENEGVFVLAATNHPWDVDTALRRPGRLDRTLLVLPPDAAAREAIIRWNLHDRPVEGVREAAIAAKTEGFSGADVTHLCDSAAEIAMEDSIESGKARPIRQADFLKARKEVSSSIGPWFETARNYALFANEGGTYDELLTYLRSRNIV